MKKSINRNVLWAELFVKRLEVLGVKYVCISPGSRNTPLIIAFQRSSKIKSFVNVDERSSGFFGLGLANKIKRPVAIVTTSGTAVAELYPSIIEAYQQRIPLLICTADRPQELLNCGANQTIDQNNIYKNHIRAFFDMGLPEIKTSSLTKLLNTTSKAFQISVNNSGPVHINFPFKPPFEPSSITDKIDLTILNKIINKTKYLSPANSEIILNKNEIEIAINKIKGSKKILIQCGQLEPNNKSLKYILKLAKEINAPIFADGLSGLRSSNQGSDLLISNHTAFLRSPKVREVLEPDLIIQFGSAPINNVILDFFERSAAYKILVNQFGELKDPSRTTDKIIRSDIPSFCNSLLENEINFKKREIDYNWINKIKRLEKLSSEIKEKQFNKTTFPFEGKLINEMIRLLPESSNLMISNSLPVRDFDFFTETTNKKINVYSNRGASGIDGIISTSAGISSHDKNPTFLLIGDLAFFHDMNGLLALKNNSIPLIIILLNNGGGGIFELLPIVKEKIDFKNYFKTPLNLNFEKFVRAYDGNYSLITGWQHFQTELQKAKTRRKFSVLEIQINSQRSLTLRKNYWKEVIKKSELMLNENRN